MLHATFEACRAFIARRNKPRMSLPTVRLPLIYIKSRRTDRDTAAQFLTPERACIAPIMHYSLSSIAIRSIKSSNGSFHAPPPCLSDCEYPPVPFKRSQLRLRKMLQ
jgi:hypothetical protein